MQPEICLTALRANLSGLKVLVTGAASGIGLATADLFGRYGATVAANHLHDDSGGAARIRRLADAGMSVFPAPADVSDPGDVQRMVMAICERMGGLDILVNNAGTPGVSSPIPFADLDAMTEDLWTTQLSTNLIGPFRTCRAAAPFLRAAAGSVVNVASIAGLGGDGSSIGYAASKAGLINLTRNLAKALGPEVRVNAVAPGLTRTPWTDGWPDERKKASVDKTMLKRLVEPEDVAQSILFLALQKAITGQVLPVDCGRQY